MKIKKGLKLQGKPRGQKCRTIEIPNAGRDDFAKFLFEEGYRTGVEIGVNEGEYGIILCKAGLKVSGVDPWEEYDNYRRPLGYRSHYEEAVKTLKDYDYTIIKKYSIDALDDFEDNSLDFVYIDGNHTLPYVCADIFGWERKVRRGGIIAGHDYAYIRGYKEKDNPPIFDGCHVKGAVDTCVHIMNIPTLYLLGERYSKTRDQWRTWFFFRP